MFSPEQHSCRRRNPVGFHCGYQRPQAKSRSERDLDRSGALRTETGAETRRDGTCFRRTSHQDGVASLPKDRAATDDSARRQTVCARHEGLRDCPDVRTVRPGKQALSGGRVDIVAEQSYPAPAQNPMSQTTSVLVAAIASDGGLRQALSTPSALSQMARSVAVPTHMLKIELHPAELGMVTASLRLAGEQLSIELKPETHEAYRRLTADSEAIVKSLRGLGFDVDKVAILQPSIAAPAATRTDASSSMPISAGRDQPSFQPGNSSGSNAGSGSQQPGRNRSNDAQQFGRTPSPVSRARWRRYVYLAWPPASRAATNPANRRSCAPPIATACLRASSMRSG